MSDFLIPLMSNNVERQDIDCLIKFLSQNPIPRMTNGPKVIQFEEEWSKWLDVKYSVMVNSGSSANILTLLALRELENDGRNSIITPNLGWVSDVSCVLHAGFKPQFCDINLKNLSYDLEKLKNTITDDTRAIIVVSVLGLNPYSKELFKICKEKNILIIGDHCESHGTTFNNKKLGSLKQEWASNFSYFFAHHLVACSEGGMISTNNKKLYNYLKAYRSHSMVREMSDKKEINKIVKENPTLNKDFIFIAPGYNMRSSEINAVVASNQLLRLDNNNKKRVDNFNYFINNLNKEKYITDFDIQGQSNYAFIVILKNGSVKKMNLLKKLLKKNLIEYRVGLSGGGNQMRQPYLKNIIKWKPEDFPNVEYISDYAVYIGNYPTLEKEKINKLLEILNNA